MKTLDRYIVRTFMCMAVLFFLVMMLLRIVVDLFLNMDEFAEKADSFAQVLSMVWSYYADHSTSNCSGRRHRSARFASATNPAYGHKRSLSSR